MLTTLLAVRPAASVTVSRIWYLPWEAYWQLAVIDDVGPTTTPLPGEGARGWCAVREQWPSQPLQVVLRFVRGEAIALDGEPMAGARLLDKVTLRLAVGAWLAAIVNVTGLLVAVWPWSSVTATFAAKVPAAG